MIYKVIYKQNTGMHNVIDFFINNKEKMLADKKLKNRALEEFYNNKTKI